MFPQWRPCVSCTTSRPNSTASSGKCTSATFLGCTPSRLLSRYERFLGKSRVLTAPLYLVNELTLCCCFVLLQGIVSLCLQFERLLQTHLPQLFYHLRQIGAQPWVKILCRPISVIIRTSYTVQNYEYTLSFFQGVCASLKSLVFLKLRPWNILNALENFQVGPKYDTHSFYILQNQTI